MDTLLDTSKNTLVNMFLTATMTRKIFMWYFIDSLLKGQRLPASVSLALGSVRQQVAGSISHNMLAMITKQSTDRYEEKAACSLVSYIASSVMEITSMGSIMMVMSMVTDEMLEAAHSGRLSTTELMHEVFAGLMVYANQIDTIHDSVLERLCHKIGHTHSNDFFPGLGHEITDCDPCETTKFAHAQMAATAHIDLVRSRLTDMIHVVRKARDYVPLPSSGVGRAHGYPDTWTPEDVRVDIDASWEIRDETFASMRTHELDKLGLLVNEVAQTLLLVGIQRKFPNETGHVFQAADGSADILIDEDTIHRRTRSCLQRAKAMRAYQGIAVSIMRVLVVATHRSHVYSRTQDYPAKLLERQAAIDDQSRL
jgi:hypothetical protein